MIITFWTLDSSIPVCVYNQSIYMFVRQHLLLNIGKHYTHILRRKKNGVKINKKKKNIDIEMCWQTKHKYFNEKKNKFTIMYSFVYDSDEIIAF